MPNTLREIFRQPEMAIGARSLALELSELLAPYESFMLAVDHANHNEVLIAQGLLREEVLTTDFFRKLDLLVNSISEHLTFVASKSGQSPSRTKQQLKRHVSIIATWYKELSERGNHLAAAFLGDALWAYKLTFIEQGMASRGLKQEPADLALDNREGVRELKEMIHWLAWRNDAHERTRRMRKEMEVFAADVNEYIEVVAPLLDCRLVISDDHKHAATVAFELGFAQMAMFGAKRLAITPQTEGNSVDLFGCHLTLHNGDSITYYINRTTCELVPPTVKYISARHLFARHDLEYVYKALQKVTFVAICEAVTLGKIVPVYWSSEEQIKEELDNTEELEIEEPPKNQEESIDNQDSQSPPEEVIAAESCDPKSVHVARGRVTWRRVLSAMKHFGVKVEWNHHPMLVKDGIRVRYANPHDNDARKNARYLHKALRAFGIDRNEFYATLMA